MAKLLRPLRSEKAAGVVGDLAYQRYRNQTLAKTRKGPDLTDSPLQIVAQTYFRLSQQAWKKLTDAQRRAWDVYAAAHSPTDKDFGPKIRSGMNMFCSCQVQMQRYSQTPIEDPPAIDAPTPIVGLYATQDMDGIHVQSAGYTNKPGQTVMLEVWATGLHSPGRHMPRQLAKFYLYDNATTPVILYTVLENGRYTFWCRHLDINTGLAAIFQQLVVDFTV
jgi:hypothetical protein